MTAFAALSTRQDWKPTTDVDWEAVVARMPLFAKLAKRDLRKLTRHAEFATFAKGDVVLVANVRENFFYVVLGGAAEVRDAAVSRRAGPGDYFGETALLNDATRSAAVVAAGELDVMRLPGTLFVWAVQRSPRAAVAILRRLGGRVGQPLPDAA